MKVRFFLKTLFLFNWTFLKILCLIGGKRDEDAFASTTWFRGAIFFGELSWDCEKVVDRQTDRLSKLAKSWNCLVRGALACSTSSPSSWFLQSCLHCCVVCCVLLCYVLCVAAAGCAAGGVGGKVKVGGWSASLLPAFTAINLIIVIIVVTALLEFTFQKSKTVQIFELRVRGITKLSP